ncbi:hypothetical protein [Curtobacterium sp. MCBA15_004]|uniref:hypothetical protein n=1 Tax=Curtobacterium sp. MCBA15_004 TaxID=1898733 RepID=UPI0008DDE1A1|nr:hypothetical protein [Curtobacterium sp. MCBA15_004]WIA97642.1 hypothetical protein QOL16_04405 [Curtobacterium sp. MCBA15_004]
MSRRTDRRGRERDAERRYEHAASVASAERLRRHAAERERDDALDRADHLARELHRLNEIHEATVGFPTAADYEQIGAEPDGSS